MRALALVFISICLSGPQLVLGSEACRVPASTLAKKSDEVLGLLNKEGCKYTYKKDRNSVIQASAELKAGYDCAQKEGRLQDAELLESSSKKLLDAFMLICAY